MANITSTSVEGRILEKKKLLASRTSRPHNSKKDSPDDIALEEDLGHDRLIDLINLTDLGKLQSARGAREEEAHNDKDRIV